MIRVHDDLKGSLRSLTRLVEKAVVPTQKHLEPNKMDPYQVIVIVPQDKGILRRARLRLLRSSSCSCPPLTRSIIHPKAIEMMLWTTYIPRTSSVPLDICLVHARQPVPGYLILLCVCDVLRQKTKIQRTTALSLGA